MENLHLLQTGRGTYFDRNINILSWTDDSKVIVGRYCSIARNCTFLLNANHRPDWITTSTMLRGPVTPELDNYLNFELGHNSSRGDILVGNDVWIGTQSIIMSGVKIGDGAVIAAGSVVTANVKPYTVVGGNPAKFLYNRFSPDIVDRLLEIKWWDWSDETVKRMSRFLWNNNLDEFFRRAEKIKHQVKTVEIVGIEDSGKKILYRNNTSQPIRVTAMFKDAGVEVYSYTYVLEPDVVYFSIHYELTNNLSFEIVDAVNNAILAETIITGEVKKPTINDEHNPDKQEETVPDSSGSSS